MRICLLNLGCKVNQYEIDALANDFSKSYEVITNLDIADCYILNTCAVTVEAEKKSRQFIAKIIKLNPSAQIIVCGCASEHNATQFTNKPNVSVIIGTAGKGNLKELMNQRIGIKVDLINDVYEDNLFSSQVRTRAYLKVQDGCNNFCNYCLIPHVRGRSRSRSLDSIIKEAQELSKTAEELVVVGINLSDFRIDGKPALGDLMRALKGLKCRIRLGSLEQNIITPEFLNILKAMPNFCPHFHLSLQSGSDKVLKEMNRHYTVDEYMRQIEMIKGIFFNAAITTDIIVGYPTETEEDFAKTLETVHKAQFSDVHYFAYSNRPGTPAGRLPQINGTIIKQREQMLKKIAEIYKSGYIKNNLGKNLNILIEEKMSDYFVGYSENYIRCYVKGNFKKGQIINAEVTEEYLDGVLAKK